MSDRSHEEGHHESPREGQDSGTDRGQDREHIGREPPRPQPQPNQGLRKRTSILVGLAFVLFGLLMLFIAGDSAASSAAKNLYTTQEKSIEY